MLQNLHIGPRALFQIEANLDQQIHNVLIQTLYFVVQIISLACINLYSGWDIDMTCAFIHSFIECGILGDFGGGAEFFKCLFLLKYQCFFQNFGKMVTIMQTCNFIPNFVKVNQAHRATQREVLGHFSGIIIIIIIIIIILVLIIIIVINILILILFLLNVGIYMILKGML